MQIPFRLRGGIPLVRRSFHQRYMPLASRDALIAENEQLRLSVAGPVYSEQASCAKLRATERPRDTGALAVATCEREELTTRIVSEASHNEAAVRFGLRPRPSRIFFMHIGKTAGSYVNDIFVRSLGAEMCAEHCEQFLHDPALFRRTIEGKRFVSGHIYYHDWMRLMADVDQQFRKVTFVRDRWSISSHTCGTSSISADQNSRTATTCAR